MEIKYVAMPISIEQKKEYHRQGFRVIDAKFAPADYEGPIETQADGVEREVEIKGERSRRRRLAED